MGVETHSLFYVKPVKEFTIIANIIFLFHKHVPLWSIYSLIVPNIASFVNFKNHIINILIVGVIMDIRSATIDRIQTLCNERKWSVRKLSTESGVSPSTIKNIFYGKSNNPGIVTIKMICDGFGISITEFFDTENFRNLEQELQ